MEGRSIRGCAGVSLEVLDDVIVPDSQYPSGQYRVSASHEHLVGFGRFLLLSDGLKNVAEPCFRGLLVMLAVHYPVAADPTPAGKIWTESRGKADRENRR